MVVEGGHAPVMQPREFLLALAQLSLQPSSGCTTHHRVGSASSSGAVACAQAPRSGRYGAQQCALQGWPGRA